MAWIMTVMGLLMKVVASVPLKPVTVKMMTVTLESMRAVRSVQKVKSVMMD